MACGGYIDVGDAVAPELGRLKILFTGGGVGLLILRL